MKTKNSNITAEFLYKSLVVAAFCYNSLLPYATQVFIRLPFIGIIGEYIVPMCMALLIVINVLYTRRLVNLEKIRVFDFIFVLLILQSLLASYVFYPDNREYFNEHNIKAVFFEAIPFFIIGLSFQSDKDTLKWLIYASYVAIAINIAYVFYYMTTRTMNSDEMYYAYLLLPHVMLVMMHMFSHSKNFMILLIKLATTIAGIIYIFAMGSRGPILIVFVFFSALIWTKSHIRLGWRLFISLLVVSIITFVVVSGTYFQLFQKIRVIMNNFNLSTRIIDFLLNKQFVSETSNRNILYSIMINKIEEKPLLGYGVFGEWQFINYSAHNIYLELCMHYGLIFGTCLLFIYLVIVLRAYIRSENQNGKDLIILFSVFTIIRGIFGGDYFSYHFMFLLGLSLHELRNNMHPHQIIYAVRM